MENGLSYQYRSWYRCSQWQPIAVRIRWCQNVKSSKAKVTRSWKRSRLRRCWPLNYLLKILMRILFKCVTEPAAAFESLNIQCHVTQPWPVSDRFDPERQIGRIRSGTIEEHAHHYTTTTYLSTGSAYACHIITVMRRRLPAFFSDASNRS